MALAREARRRKEENQTMKRLVVLASVLTIAAGLIWMSRPAKAQAFSNLPFDAIVVGYKIAPVPLKLTGLDPFLVGWGSYTVNAVGGCNDCHTNPPYAAGGDPYSGQPKKINTAGYLGGGMAFGPFTSRNLTPEANGMPAGLDQFTQAFTTGKDFDNAHPQLGPLLQVMPWPVYSNMTPLQIRAIYEYLSAIPSVKVAGVQ
jgi:hypothetical protein